MLELAAKEYVPSDFPKLNAAEDDPDAEPLFAAKLLYPDAVPLFTVTLLEPVAEFPIQTAFFNALSSMYDSFSGISVET